MTKKTRKILLIIVLSLLSLFVGIILILGVIFHRVFVKPTNDAVAEAKSKAAFLLQIPSRTNLYKVGEAGMSETIDNNNHCYTYAFQGATNYSTAKTVANALVREAGYTLNSSVATETENAYKVSTQASDGWTTKLQAIKNAGLVKVTENVIDNPVSTKVADGQILVSGQVCNI
jgi:hypothetical protein